MYSFYLNEDEEIQTLNKMLADGGVCSVSQRAEQYHIPFDIARKCSKEKVPCELIDFIKKCYQERHEGLEKALTFHLDFWNRNSPECQRKLNKIMQQDIPEFNVRLNVKCGGISDWVGTNLAINAFDYLSQNPVWYSTLIWETILALSFQRIRHKYPCSVYNDATVWAVSEMSACAIINQEFNVCWNIGYDQLAPHQANVIQYYQDKKDFTDFLEKLLKYFAEKEIHF